MKNVIIVFIVFLSFSAQSQNAFFVDKKGKKTIMRDDAVDFIPFDKRVSYKQVGKTWEKYIKFSDLNYMKWNGYIFKNFKVGKDKKEKSLFLVAETKTHKLFTVAITNTTTSARGTTMGSTTWYEFLITDDKLNVIENLTFTSARRDIEDREKIGPLVRKYFADCDQIIQNLAQTGDAADQIGDFVSAPTYINCQ
ncbi:hypothetical protein [Flavobacterium sp. SM2513]|uniref:hypothetical protein n=1 Tax=Flavobacterium sp. SM2513 TaxID=3424766 RepID=UPI003D7FFA49